MPAYKYQKIKKEFPNSLKNQRLVLSLPIYPELRIKEVRYISRMIKNFINFEKKFLHIFDIYKDLKNEIYKDKSILSLSFDEHKKILDKNFSWSLNVKETFKRL